MVTVYILEAHADDEWPISSARFSADGRAVHVLQPRSNHGRCQLARRFVADYDFAEALVLVDPCDQGNPFEAAYAPWPLRFYGIAGEGRMGYVAHPRDCSYECSASAARLGAVRGCGAGDGTGLDHIRGAEERGAARARMTGRSRNLTDLRRGGT